MKRVLFAMFLLFSVAGCKTVENIRGSKELGSINEVKNFYAIDFTKYSANGFLITPEKYQGEYNSIGIIRYEVYPSAVYKTVSTMENPAWTPTGIEPRVLQIKEWDIKKNTLQDVLDGMYEECKKMGADALVNFDVKNEMVPYTGISNPVQINGNIITGFAIKRK